MGTFFMSVIPQTSPKQQFITILQQQPEESTQDELFRELMFARMIDRGLKDIQAGRVVSNNEVRGWISGKQASVVDEGRIAMGFKAACISS
jgi:hypothetical protein